MRRSDPLYQILLLYFGESSSDFYFANRLSDSHDDAKISPKPKGISREEYNRVSRSRESRWELEDIRADAWPSEHQKFERKSRGEAAWPAKHRPVICSVETVMRQRRHFAVVQFHRDNNRNSNGDEHRGKAAAAITMFREQSKKHEHASDPLSTSSALFSSSGCFAAAFGRQRVKNKTPDTYFTPGLFTGGEYRERASCDVAFWVIVV